MGICFRAKEILEKSHLRDRVRLRFHVKHSGLYAVWFAVKWINRLESAAGLMPGIRRAWPKFSGSAFSKRSTIS